MTTVRFFRSGGIFYGFEETGHAGYAEEGADIVCSALSSMTMLIINAIEVSFESRADYTVDDGTASVRLIAEAALDSDDARKQYAVSGLIYAYYCQLTELLDEYSDYLSVEVLDRDPK